MPEESQHCIVTPSGRIPYVLRRTSRRRTIELSIPASTAARILAPQHVSLETIERFIHSRSLWVIKHLEQRKAEELRVQYNTYETGSQFLYLGRAYPLNVQRGQRLVTKIVFNSSGWDVLSHAAPSQKIIKNKLIRWYRIEAGEIFGARVFYYSRLMGLDKVGLEPQKITVKTQKRLWGSCNHQGKSINLNWTLIMAPLEVIDYVVVHELCHLEVPNHSTRFWRKVAKIMPDYKVRETWLKQNAGQMRLL